MQVRFRDLKPGQLFKEVADKAGYKGECVYKKVSEVLVHGSKINAKCGSLITYFYDDEPVEVV